MKTIVFTAILGNRCDSLKPAPVGADRCVCFVSDPSAYPDHKGWELIVHPAVNHRREAWQIRALPHLFPKLDADRVIWIDASFTLTDLPRLLRDTGSASIAAIRHYRRRSPYDEAKELVKIGQSDPESLQRQVKSYRAAGFNPKHLSISCIIVRDRSAAVLDFNRRWAAEFTKYPGDNTQVSLDYAAWSNGLEIKALQGTRHDNPYAIHDHEDHKRRRVPYDKPAFGDGANVILHGTESVIR